MSGLPCNFKRRRWVRFASSGGRGGEAEVGKVDGGGAVFFGFTDAIEGDPVGGVGHGRVTVNEDVAQVSDLRGQTKGLSYVNGHYGFA